MVKVNYEKEKDIKIISRDIRRVIGVYRSDFIIDNKIIVELEAAAFLSKAKES